MQTQSNKSHLPNNYNELFFIAKSIEQKIDLQKSKDADIEILKNISLAFKNQNKISENLFCQKLIIKHSLNNASNNLSVINTIHDWAIELVIEAEAHKIFQASFYNLLVKVKSILSGLLTQDSYEQLAIANSGKAYLQKARKLFPTYTKLNNYF